MTEISAPWLTKGEATAGPIDRDVARRLALASDGRRRQMERLLHDGVQQHMALMGLRLSMLRKTIDSQPDAAGAMCDELREEILSALNDLRTVAHLIYPAILENEGLVAALSQAARRLGVELVATVEADGLPDAVTSSFYFCCLEVFESAKERGGTGTRVEVDIHREGTSAVLIVTDRAVDLLPEDHRPEGGLQHVADRMVAFGGSCRITSDTELGTRVVGELPIFGL